MSGGFMLRIIVYALLIAWMTGCGSLGLTRVSSDGREFKEAFGRWADWPRLVLIYSPT